MSLSDISARLAPHRLAVFGGFHPGPDDGAPPGTRTLLLIGPDEPGFWPRFTADPEWQDGRPDPMDRWSRRVIGRIACDLAAKAVFPFGGPPFAPFYRWALASGRAWASPVHLLVHDRAGLMVSYRGALALKRHLDLPPPPPCPCDGCPRPCLSACPATALTGAGYDVPACRTWLATSGTDCLAAGCQVRRACPVAQSYGRVESQSAYHMSMFHK